MKKSYTYAGISILCWSTVAVITKLLLGEFNNFQVLWISSLFAGLSLLLVNIATGNIKKLKGYSAKDIVISILIGIPSTIFYYIFYYAGTDLMLASQAFIVNYLWPIMSVVFACIILKEQMTFRKVIAIMLSFMGVVIVTLGEITSFNLNMLLGTVCCILGAISYGLFTALNQKFKYDNRITMTLSYFVTFVVTTIINGINGNLFLPSFVQTLGFAWNGIFTMGIANTLWVLALNSAKNTAKVSNLAYITPFLSLVWTSVVLKEKLNLLFVAGLVTIVIGILIQLKDKKEV